MNSLFSTSTDASSGELARDCIRPPFSMVASGLAPLPSSALVLYWKDAPWHDQVQVLIILSDRAGAVQENKMKSRTFINFLQRTIRGTHVGRTARPVSAL